MGIFQNGYFLPLFAGSKKASSQWEPDAASGGKTPSRAGVGGVPLKLGPLEVFNSGTCPHRAPSNSSVTMYRVPIDLASSCGFLLLLICDFLYLPVCFSSFQGSSLPGDLSTLLDVRIVDFQFLQLFSCCEDEWRLPSPWYVGSGTRVSVHVCVCTHFIDFWMVNHSRTAKTNSSLSWCIILFMYGGIQLANILLRIFHLYSWGKLPGSSSFS